MNDTNRCMKCGAQNPEHKLSFLVVDVDVQQSVTRSGRKQVTTTTTTESFAGREKYIVCDPCIKKRRSLFSFQEGIAGLFATAFLMILFALMFTNNATFNRHAGLIFTTALVIGMTVGVIVFLVSMKKETPFIAGMLLKKSKGKAGNRKVFVPMEQRLYVSKKTGLPDLEIFKNKTGLKTGVGVAIFTKLIATGFGEMLDFLDFEVPQTTENPTPAVTPETAKTTEDPTPAAAPETAKTPASLLDDSVNQLVKLYQRAPEGYLRANATEVRQIGTSLHAAGGMSLMLQAHERFAAGNPRMARNLEMVWDGIGDWMG